MNIPDYLATFDTRHKPRGYRNGYYPRGVLPITCVNGLRFSVRKIDREERTAELTNLGRSIAALEPYRRRPSTDHHKSDTYYADVPVDLINRLIMRNGGLGSIERINEIIYNQKLLLPG